MRVPGGYSVRIATVVRTNRTFVECQYLDRAGEHNIICPVPHPYAGPNGGGLFVGIEKGTWVLIGYGPQERPYIVGIIPERSLYFDQSGVSNSSVDVNSYPNVSEGEIFIRGPGNSKIDVAQNISLDVGAGNLESDLEFSPFSKAMFVRPSNIYKFTEAGREIEGIIRRDVSDSEDPNDTTTVNFLSGQDYDYLLADIGRSTANDVSLRSSQVSQLTIRNPALIEKRNIIYEFADSFGVKDINSEASASLLITKENISDVTSNIIIDPSTRPRRRTDTLDLNLRNFNHLIEKTEGTVVDIYGNVLDINRNKINIPSVENLDTKNGTTDSLQRTYSFLRRSIKYHFEINSRKDSKFIDPPLQNGLYNFTEHSRWSVDVDGEGLTKINIPASSETGNIPVLARYVVSRNTAKDSSDGKDPANQGQFKDSQKQDVRILPFGFKTSDGSFSGPSISDNSYSPNIVNDGYLSIVSTAHHDIMNIAPSVFNTGKLRIPNPSINSDSYGPINSNINNIIIPLQSDNTYQTNPNANAGGRSLHMNLDGSAEIAIGADTIDRKSFVIDTAGGVISHYGRDRNGRSLIHQTDGDVIIQIGGIGISGDKRFISQTDTENRPGRIEIDLNRPDGYSQQIIIDENGMTINIQGNIVLTSSGDFAVSAGGTLLLHGTTVAIHGDVDNSADGNRNIIGTERLILRNGRQI